MSDKEAGIEVQGRVEDGSGGIYHVKLDDGPVVKSAMMNSSRLVDDPLTWDDRAWITFAPDAGVVLTR